MPSGAAAAGENCAGVGEQDGRTLNCRKFWKAGNYEVHSAASHELHDGIEPNDFDRARVHPKFLHTNATSHKWAFGAIAELLDNAVDEICNGATFVKIDKTINVKDSSPMLLFQDNGGGMDPEGVRHCMSLGFSNKRSKTTIGQYGNGFKTSTMRLGADVILFTRAKRGSQMTMSIGFLSYTFLRRTMKDDIIVPMLDFKIQDGHILPLIYSCDEEWDSSLKIMLDWSPFSSKEELLQQFEDIDSQGTKVLIYNLWMNDDNLLELDFEDDDEDIILRDQANVGGFPRNHKDIVLQHFSHRLRFSLRAYVSVLYMRAFSNFMIILRGKPVEQIKIADEMKFKKVVTYKPQVGVHSEVVTVRTTIGFAKEAPILGIFGINVYHKNRLIMPFWKVLQEGSSRGRNVVGVLEANFIEPAHDKQDFERTPLFIRLETKLRQIILDYWKDNCHLIGYQPVNSELKPKPQYCQKTSGSVPSKLRRTEQAGNGADDLDQPCDNFVNVDLAEDYNVSGDVTQGNNDVIDLDGLDEVENQAGSRETINPSLVQKLSEENIQLTSRCEELRQRDERLRQTIEQLERELIDTRRRCVDAAAKLRAYKSLQGP